MAAKFRHALPQLADKLFITDSGLETTLCFHDGIDLPHFAAIDLMKDDVGRQRLWNYYNLHLRIAQAMDRGFILESPTWRSSSDWAEKIGLSKNQLKAMNYAAIELMDDIRAQYTDWSSDIVISGCVGPRGDGYAPDEVMSADEAQEYHAEQIMLFADTEADMVTAITMNYAEEAIGVAKAAKIASIPSVISFTTETNGLLPTGQSLKEAIEFVDRETNNAPAYYMINCAHTSHFGHVLDADEPWINRIRGLRANASRKSHEELDNSTELDEGNPVELGNDYAALLGLLPQITVIGGCCGTDHRHIEAMAKACSPLATNRQAAA